MPDPGDGVLDIRLGAHTIRENLDRAVAAGHLTRHADGTLTIRESWPNWWIRFENAPHPPCKFLFYFLFRLAYGRAAVPYGCRDCYKVKVMPKDLRQTMALKKLAEPVACRSKCGSEVDMPYSRNLWGGYFYTLGLDKARAIYREVRAAVDADPVLGPDVPMLIKRGCTEYEIHCGPSDTYEVRPELADVEEYLKNVLRPFPNHVPQTRPEAQAVTLHWIATAHRVGDETYTEFTDGRLAYRPPVTYDPE